MDGEQTFIRVQERFSKILTPKVRAALEYIYLFIAITLFFILVVMHANYVQQVLVLQICILLCEFILHSELIIVVAPLDCQCL